MDVELGHVYLHLRMYRRYTEVVGVSNRCLWLPSPMLGVDRARPSLYGCFSSLSAQISLDLAEFNSRVLFVYYS